ncbi:MAG: DUF1569 domain-containing protein [Myxococcota bacterium]|nr:DUF1569 domain-containing protein [Myxococcota bacterium]
MSAVRFTRKRLLLGMAATAVGALGVRTAAASALSYPEGAPGQRLRFQSLAEALTEVKARASSPTLRTSGAWNWAQILEHCAQSIEYSLTGYPENKSAVIRRTVGPLVHAHFAHQGYMKHALTAAIPGAPPLALPGAPELALARLEKAISDFQARTEPLAPHFVYGELSKPEYDRVQAMHLANHLSEVS